MSRFWIASNGYSMLFQAPGYRADVIVFDGANAPVFTKSYEWHEVKHAESECEALATAANMNEVGAGEFFLHAPIETRSEQAA